MDRKDFLCYQGLAWRWYVSADQLLLHLEGCLHRYEYTERIHLKAHGILIAAAASDYLLL